MNYGRLALTAVVATVVDFIYGFVYGTRSSRANSRGIQTCSGPLDTQMAFCRHCSSASSLPCSRWR